MIWNFSISGVFFASKLTRHEPSDFARGREIWLAVARENNYACAEHGKPILTFSDVFTCKIKGGALLIFKYLETKAISFLWKLSVIKIAIKCLMIVLLNKESAYHLWSLTIWTDKRHKRETKRRFQPMILKFIFISIARHFSSSQHHGGQLLFYFQNLIS